MYKKNFYVCGSFLPSWIRIANPDTDPGTPLNPDPLRIQIHCCAPYLAADEAGKMNGEMAAEEGLAARDGEDGGEQLGVELGLQHDQRPVHTGPAQVGRVLGQVHLTKHRIMGSAL